MKHLSKGRKSAFWLNIWFALFCRNFSFVVIYALFSAKSVLPKFQSSLKNGFFQVWLVFHFKRMCIDYLWNFQFPLSIVSIIDQGGGDIYEPCHVHLVITDQELVWSILKQNIIYQGKKMFVLGPLNLICQVRS